MTRPIAAGMRAMRTYRIPRRVFINARPRFTLAGRRPAEHFACNRNREITGSASDIQDMKTSGFAVSPCRHRAFRTVRLEDIFQCPFTPCLVYVKRHDMVQLVILRGNAVEHILDIFFFRHNLIV